MSDFYYNLSKNVAFGGIEAKLRKREEKVDADTSEKGSSSTNTHTDSSVINEGHEGHEGHEGKTSTPKESSQSLDIKPVSDASAQEKALAEETLAQQPKSDHHKRSEDAVAAAKERFLARKRAKQQ